MSSSILIQIFETISVDQFKLCVQPLPTNQFGFSHGTVPSTSSGSAGNEYGHVRPVVLGQSYGALSTAFLMHCPLLLNTCCLQVAVVLEATMLRWTADARVTTVIWLSRPPAFCKMPKNVYQLQLEIKKCKHCCWQMRLFNGHVTTANPQLYLTELESICPVFFKKSLIVVARLPNRQESGPRPCHSLSHCWCWPSR